MTIATSFPVSQVPAMQPETIVCENVRADSAVCGEAALVRGMRYVYERPNGIDILSGNPVLREIQHRIECPRCGHRTQIQRFE
jgi:hypothetical protein